MLRLAMICFLATSTLSLAGCGSTPQAGAPATALASRCGQPTRWTAAQRNKVADALERWRDDPGLGLLATEWDRETAAIRICRGGK